MSLTKTIKQQEESIDEEKAEVKNMKENLNKSESLLHQNKSITVDFCSKVLTALKTTQAKEMKASLGTEDFNSMISNVASVLFNELRQFRNALEERDDKIQIQNEKILNMMREGQLMRSDDKSSEAARLRSQVKLKEEEISRLSKRVEEILRNNRGAIDEKEEEIEKLNRTIEDLVRKEESERKLVETMKEKVTKMEISKQNEHLKMMGFLINQYFDKTKEYFARLGEKLT